jgi:tetratricopeptide (TPR) repeat protein
MTALSEAFAAALQLHRAGQTRQAEEICRRILKEEPQNAQALHLLGVLAQQAGRNDEALALLRRAIALCPDDADFHYNLGVVRQLLGRHHEAMASYHETLRLQPDHASALNNLGQLKLNLGRLEEAEDCLRRALRVQANYGAAYHNLALVCKRRGKIGEAIACFRQAVRLLPNDPVIHFHLGQTLEEYSKSEEALAAFRQSAHTQDVPNWRRQPTEEALIAFREAVRLRPDSATFQCALGNLLTLRRQLNEALPHYEQALRCEPNDPAHYSNLGNLLTQLGRPQEAEKLCRQAIHLQADFVNAHHNLATALAAQGRLEEALRSIEDVLRIKPDHAGARHCRALWRLQLGNFAEGWPEYEWRWKLPDMVGRQCREPLWDGSPLNGKTILLWAEQGLGDTLQAIRFAPLVKQRGGAVVVECQAPLVPLLSRCAGIDRLVPRGSPAPAVDVQAPLMSLPWLLGTTLETLPADVPYLFADPALVEQWRRELEGPPGLKIGIAWQGNPLYSGDCMRSIPLKHFAALACLPSVRLFSLQKGVGSEQREAVSEQFYVVDLGCRLDETAGAFMDTAAVIQNLDLVVTSDTSVAHLAGGLGKAVWVALSIGCDWRFFQHREDNPWYPTMRLFRQTHFGDWDEVFARMATELALRARSASDGHLPGPSPAVLAQLWNRALAHFQAKEREAAEQLCRQLLDAEPCHAEALNLLGVLAHQAGQNELARQRLERAVALRPQEAGFHYNLGVARHMLGQTAEAAASYRQALRFQPDNTAAFDNLGHALLALGQHAEARKHLEEAIRLRPNHADSHNRLGIVAREQGRIDEAIMHYRKAIQLEPRLAAAHHNLGLSLAELGRYQEALACYEQAAQLNPDHSEARFARAMTWLLLGDFERGWRDYEYRWQYRPAPKPAGPQPLWDGSPLNGQTILLWAEQGLGDTIMFIRYASLVKRQGGAVVVQCPAKLSRLLASCPDIDRLVPHNAALPAYDVQAPLLSLPRIFGTTLESVPANVPYLAAERDLVESWRRELSSLDGFRVGIAWQGDPAYRGDRYRSIPLRHFAPLARVPGVRLISLQKGPGAEQLDEVAGQFPVIDLGPRLDETGDAFVDTAAVMKGLDLVITSDTAVAHLAGALDVPVWLALTFAPEWRWLLEREDSPWYPSMRLFRQARRGDWEGIFTRMADELRRKIGKAAPLEVFVPVAPGELIDKITILEIKMERIREAAKLANVRAELAELTAVRDRCLPRSVELARLTSSLKAVNETLWQIEDAIRDCERAQDFGPRFIELARSVYQNNDRRAALKRQINERLGSRLLEEKSYATY